MGVYLEQFQSRFDNMIAFRPSGWTFSGPSSTPIATKDPTDSDNMNDDGGSNITPISVAPDGRFLLFGVPYSEHSSYSELQHFIQNIDARRIIPTVNVGDERRRRDMDRLFREWQQTKVKRLESSTADTVRIQEFAVSSTL